MTSQFDIESYGISDIGLSRANNEDVWVELPDYNFYALADGIGGHLGGEVAAKEAVLELCDAIDNFFSKERVHTVETASKIIKQGISKANTWVSSLARQHAELSGMGTTLCSLLFLKQTAIYTHLGDSRIYRFREKLERLTQDHSSRQRVITKKLDEKGLPIVKIKNVITQAIGIMDKVSPEINTVPIQKGDIFLLCTDGLTDCVTDSEIEEILRNETSVKEASLQLVEKAKNGGGNDNITVVIIKIS